MTSLSIPPSSARNHPLGIGSTSLPLLLFAFSPRRSAAAPAEVHLLYARESNLPFFEQTSALVFDDLDIERTGIETELLSSKLQSLRARSFFKLIYHLDRSS